MLGACASRCVRRALTLLQHTGRIRMFGQDATLLFEAYVIGLLERLQRGA
ncbi:hypothetical protein LP417_32275 [Polaromonas sp. P1-6]|nr:hypothetical protein LP417_32275 [Polaromonas sp. P1-6]